MNILICISYVYDQFLYDKTYETLNLILKFNSIYVCKIFKIKIYYGIRMLS